MEFRVSKKDRYKSGIYKISNTIDDRIYYGSAENFSRRFQSHKAGLLAEKRDRANAHLFNFVKKYGFDKLIFEVVELVEPQFLFQVEQSYLDDLFLNKKPRFNIAKKATNNGYQNLNHPGEHGRRISLALKGKKKSETYSINFSIAKGRPIGQFDLNGNLIARFEANMFVKRAGFDEECVRRVCVGQRLSYKGCFWSYLEDKSGDKIDTSFDTSKKHKVRYEKEVSRFDKRGKFIKKYKTSWQAHIDTGHSSFSIRNACLKKQESLKFGIWLYTQEFGEKDLTKEELALIRGRRLPLYSGYTEQGEIICGPSSVNSFYKKFKYDASSIKRASEKTTQYKGLFWIKE